MIQRTDALDSAHCHVSTIKGRVYVGSVGVDASFPPEQSGRWAEIDHVIGNYVGIAHGWAVPDHTMFDHAGSERHWKRLLALFEETLS